MILAFRVDLIHAGQSPLKKKKKEERKKKKASEGKE